METVFDDLGKALESKPYNAGAGVAFFVLAGAFALGLGIVVVLVDRSSTSEVRPGHDIIWGGRHVIT